METQHEKSLRLLREYLQKATPEEKQKLIDEISAQGIEGPTFEEYLERLREHYPKTWLSIKQTTTASSSSE